MRMLTLRLHLLKKERMRGSEQPYAPAFIGTQACARKEGVAEQRYLTNEGSTTAET